MVRIAFDLGTLIKVDIADLAETIPEAIGVGLVSPGQTHNADCQTPEMSRFAFNPILIKRKPLQVLLPEPPSSTLEW